VSVAAPKSPWSWQQLLPGLATMRRYERSWLSGDIVAGLAVAAYLVPQVMAYAEVARLPAIVGLWACIGPLLAYAVLGTSRILSAGPESTTALMTAAGVAAIAHDSGIPPAAVAATLALAVGILCILGFFGRLGFLATLISRPVLVGYMAGVAVLMIISQLGKLTGIPVTGSSVVDEVWHFLRQLDQIHVPSLTLAMTALAALFLNGWRFPKLPGTLLVMVLAALVVGVFDLQRYGIRTIGAVPEGLPAPTVPPLTGLDLTQLGTAAVGMAIIAYSDTVLTARAFADRRGERIDANQELLALGASNVLSGLFHGFPTSSSGSRTAIADSSRAHTQAYALVALLLVLATVLFLGPAIATFPLAVLAAVVVYAAVRLIDVAEMARIGRYRTSELALCLVTAVAVVVVGVLPGIGVAVGLSILMLLRRITKPHDAIEGYVAGVAGMHDIDDYPSAEQVPGLVIFRYDAPLFFANAEDFRSRALAAFREAQVRPHWFALNMEANTELDLTAADALESVRAAVTAAGAEFAVVRVKQELCEKLERAGLLERIGPDRVFMTLPTMVEGFTGWHEERRRQSPPR
jgi:SulP family sulfate permease